MIIREQVALAERTSFRIGGRARYFAEPRDEAELLEAMRWIERQRMPLFVLGGGTNTLVPDGGFEGLVVSTRLLRGFRVLGGGRVAVAGGTNLRSAILRCIRHGLAGVETLVGIPGTIGGAVFGNAGGADRVIGEVVTSVVLAEPGGRRRRLPGDAISWAYRSSGLGAGVVSEVELALEPGNPQALEAQAKRVFQRKYSTQPLRAASAGCVFRNPPGRRAGQLVDAAGLKGLRIGGAAVSERHANFIVNEDNARAADVEALIATVRERVLDRFGVALQCEIVSPPAPAVTGAETER